MIQYSVYMNAEQLYAVHTEESENKTQDKRNTRKGVEERKNASVTLIVIYINIWYFSFEIVEPVPVAGQ